MVGKCRNVEIVSGGIAINHEKGLDTQRLLNCWQSKAAPILHDDLRRFERRRASLAAQSGSDLVDIPQHHFALNTTVCMPAGDGFQGANGRKGNAMAGVHGSGRASHQDGRGYFRLQQRGMREKGFPVGDFRFLGHSAAASRGLRGSLRNSAAKARALGSRLPSV